MPLLRKSDFGIIHYRSISKFTRTKDFATESDFFFRERQKRRAPEKETLTRFSQMSSLSFKSEGNFFYTLDFVFVNLGYMVLIDKDIRALAEHGQLIVAGFNPDNLGAVSYDLSIDSFVGSDSTDCRLRPSETIFVKSKELLQIPYNLIARPAEKNSRMRQGLIVSAPIYQPGHKTFVFMRVQNIRNESIHLKQGDKILQLYFDQLTAKPETPYDQNQNANFNQEMEFIGLGKYSSEYQKQIEKIEQASEKAEQKIETITEKIYPNVIALMGIITAIISTIAINSSVFAKSDIDFQFVILMNSTLIFSIASLFGLILFFVKRETIKSFFVFYAVLLGILALANFLILK